MKLGETLGAVICGGRHACKKTLGPEEKRTLVSQLKAMDCLAGHAEYREETKPVDVPPAPGSAAVN